MKYNILLSILILCIGLIPPVLFSSSDTGNLIVSEQLQYSVSYLGIRIGTIDVRNTFASTDSSIISGLESSTEITLRSFSGIPFLAVHTEFIGATNENGIFTKSDTFDRQRNSWAYYSASYEKTKGFILIERGHKDERYSPSPYNVEIDTVFSDNLVHDALTFINLMRRAADKEIPLEIDILVDRNIEKLYIELPTSIDTLTVAAFDEPQGAFLVSGVLNFESIHGLSRNFQAWISTDKYRIPLRAKVNIAIGSININLQEYNVSYDLSDT